MKDWQLIETAKSDVKALLWTPATAIYEKPPKGRADDMRVAEPRNWTWATHWMPLPDPPSLSHKDARIRRRGRNHEEEYARVDSQW
jgi:hypothetical protein